VQRQSLQTVEEDRQRMLSVLSRHLPAITPEELEKKKNGFLKAMRFGFVVAGLLVVLAMASVVGAVYTVVRVRRPPPIKATEPAAPVADKPITLEMDGGGMIVRWSDDAEHLYGYDAHEIEGQPITRLFASDSEIERLYKELQSVHRTTFETVHKTKTGNAVPVRIDFRAVQDDAHPKAVIGLVCARR
jgi:PAS domain S-box-containing protein